MSEKDKVVVFMGSFNPPHKGHLLMIDRILAVRKELHLFVRYNEGVDLASREMKMKWFERISADRDHRIHIHMFSTDDFKGKSYTGSIFASFIRLFEDTFGAEKTGCLYSQYPFYDIYQDSRFADFLLENGGRRVAIEVDDDASHLPGHVSERNEMTERFASGKIRVI